jgi:hypothetical protein
LLELTDVLEDSGVTLPDELRGLDSLNPFAVEARYDFLPPSSSSLDRKLLRSQIRLLRAWAEALVKRTE